MTPIRTLLSAAALTASVLAVPAAASLPTPPQAAATREAQAYLFHAGAGDVFEITSSMLAIQKSQNPNVRAFATMLIDHHTRTTNQSLAAARQGGVMPPPPELSPMQKDMIGQLHGAAPGAAFDRLYLQQQVPAHQQALQINAGYAQGGDNPVLRQNAASAVPIIQSHLEQAAQLLGPAR